MKKGFTALAIIGAALWFPADSGAGWKRYDRTEPVQDQPVVADAVTGLVWQGCPAGQGGIDCAAGGAGGFTWDQALSYCDGLTWGGHDDWYLPGVKELSGILDDGRTSPSIDTTAFPATPASWFWTSSSVSAAPGYAWHLYFDDGYVDSGYKDSGNSVRCVRRGP